MLSIRVESTSFYVYRDKMFINSLPSIYQIKLFFVTVYQPNLILFITEKSDPNNHIQYTVTVLQYIIPGFTNVCYLLKKL